MGLYRLTGWTIYTDDTDVMTFRHKCGYETYADLDYNGEPGEALKNVRDHVC